MRTLNDAIAQLLNDGVSTRDIINSLTRNAAALITAATASPDDAHAALCDVVLRMRTNVDYFYRSRDVH